MDGDEPTGRPAWSAEADQPAFFDPPPPDVEGAADAVEEEEEDLPSFEDELSLDDPEPDDAEPSFDDELSFDEEDDEAPLDEEALARLSVR